MIKSKVKVLSILSLILAVTALIASAIGSFEISIKSILTLSLSDQESIVLSSIRLPRVFLAVIVGASLAISGAVMQGLFRNPLADPGLIGISSGAALAVAVMIVLVGPLTGILGFYGISFAAFFGGLITAIVIFRFSQVTGSFSVAYILLAGIAISALSAAGTGFLIFLSNDEQLRSLTFWTMGSLGSALWESVIVAASIIIPTSIIMIKNSRALNIMLLGENEAKYLGVNCDRLKKVIIICAALSVGASVAVSGIIGFVGLVVPHLVRLTIGADHRMLIPASAILGAILLLIADTFARTIVAPAEMPVGVITSLIGGPFFLWLLARQYKGRI